MLYGIKITKPKIASNMIQSLSLSGSETVLDLGCGRGLLLCEAAKNLPNGEAHGIDLWNSHDQSGNRKEETLENAYREGVKDRITIHTGDIRDLPFADSTFDAVTSSLCLHNIKEKKDREKALLEMLRVLKTDGKFIIADILQAQEYLKFLTQQGIYVECSRPTYSYCPPITIVKGKKLHSIS